MSSLHGKPSDPRSDAPDAGWRRVLSLTIVAVLLLAFTSLYRFNTLGGRFGGFDNDHFVPFAYAKQVQAGEQPLRDFDGLGLQGAWPSLTYETSAWMQRWLGDNLRSEALLSVIAVGVAAALTFLAAASLAPVAWATATTLVSVFVAPTLYNYSKVLMLAAAALTIARYCRRPHTLGVVAGSVLTAVAFLFRHDLAVYVGVGLGLAYLLGSGRPERVRRVCLYVALTLLLLAPSLIWVQYYAGLVQYVRDGLALSAREADRTEMSAWPGFTGLDESGNPVGIVQLFDVEQNGTAWLYYLTRLLPFAAAAFVWVRRGDGEWSGAQPALRRGSRPAVLAIAAMTAFASPLLVRGNIPVRLGDIGPLVSVLAAWTIYQVARWRTGEPLGWRVARSMTALVIIGATALSTASVGVVRNQLGTAGLRHSWRATMLQSQQLWASLSTLPPAAIDQPSPDGPLDISQYINRCTAPADRVVVMSYQPELLPFAGRLFGAGRLSILPAYALDSRQAESLVTRWRHQSVPLAFVEFEEFWSPDSTRSPIVRAYLHERYAEAGSMPVGGDRVLHVFAERARMPSGRFGLGGLPCFR
jgi:hypothetical protein